MPFRSHVCLPFCETFACPFELMSTCFLKGLRTSASAFPFKVMSTCFLDICEWAPLHALSKSCLLVSSMVRGRDLCMPFQSYVCLFPRWLRTGAIACPFEIMSPCFLDGSRTCPLHTFSKSCLLVFSMAQGRALYMPFKICVCLFPRWFEDEPFACPFDVMSACFLTGLRTSTSACPFVVMSACPFTSPLLAFSKSCLLAVCERFACPFEVMSACFLDGSRTTPLHAFSKSCLHAILRAPCLPIRGHISLFPR